jgi:protein arginine kinase activator
MKCDKCNKPATVHLTEIQGGKQISKHLCEQCATQGGEGLLKVHAPINELLEKFVQQHSGLPKEGTSTCEHCGISWADFRQGGLLGCQHDYVLFDKELTPLLQRAHENATHHLGKVPRRAVTAAGGGGALAKRQVDVAKLRKELAKAVESEDYERAAKLRDQIKEAEGV